MIKWLISKLHTSKTYTDEQMQADHDESVANFLSTYQDNDDE